MSDEVLKPLTDKQEAYCQAYVICMNQSTAYRMAYDAEAMNSNTIAVRACELHANSNITVRIKELQREAYDRNKATIDEIVNVLSNMIRFDVSELYDEHGSLKSIHDIPLTARQMISELQVDEMKVQGVTMGYSKKIKTISKLDAIEKAMKHLGGYEKDNFQKKPEIQKSVEVTIVKPSDEEE